MTHHPPVSERSKGTVFEKALVVGGVEGFIKTTIGPKLRLHGLLVEKHVPMASKMHSHVPSGIDAVVLLQDVVPHRGVVDAFTRAAQQAGIHPKKIIVTVRQYGANFGLKASLENAGYPLVSPVAAAAMGDIEATGTPVSQPVTVTQEKPAVSVPTKQPTAAPVTTAVARDDSFEGRKLMLLVLLKEMHEKDGLKEIKGWSADAPERLRYSREVRIVRTEEFDEVV